MDKRYPPPSEDRDLDLLVDCSSPAYLVGVTEQDLLDRLRGIRWRLDRPVSALLDRRAAQELLDRVTAAVEELGALIEELDAR